MRQLAGALGLLLCLDAFAQAATELPTLSIRARGPADQNSLLMDSQALDQDGLAPIEAKLLQRAELSGFRLGGTARLHPTAQGLSLRGLSSNSTSRVRVLVDGIPLNDPFAGWVHWQRLPKDWITQARLRTHTSLDGGGGAGLLELDSGQPPPLQSHVRAGLGSDGQKLMRASTVQQSKQAYWGLHAEHSAQDGQSLVPQRQAGTIDQAADRQANSAHLRWGHITDSGIQWQIGLESWHHQRGNGTALTDNLHRGQQLSVGRDAQAGRHASSLRLYHQDAEFGSRFSAQAEDRNSESPALDQFSVPVQASGLLWTQIWSEAKQQWQLTMDGRQVRGETREHFRFVNGEFERRRTAASDEQAGGAYLQWQGDYGRLQPLAGLRLDLWQLGEARRLETRRSDGSVLRQESSPARSGHSLSPMLGLNWQATEHWTMRVSAYRSLRLPTINERVRPFRVRNDITEANAELRGERLSALEFGAQWSRNAWSVHATAFALQLERAIGNHFIADGQGAVIAPCGFVPSSGSCSQRRNLGRIDNQGLEVSGKWQGGQQWLQASALIQDPRVAQSAIAPELEDQRVAQQPRHRLQLEIGHIWDAHQFRLGGIYEGARFEDDRNKRQLGTAIRWDASWRWSLDADWQLDLRIENLLDREIVISEASSGLQNLDTGRNALLSLRWTR